MRRTVASICSSSLLPLSRNAVFSAERTACIWADASLKALLPWEWWADGAEATEAGARGERSSCSSACGVNGDCVAASDVAAVLLSLEGSLATGRDSVAGADVGSSPRAVLGNSFLLEDLELVPEALWLRSDPVCDLRELFKEQERRNTALSAHSLDMRLCFAGVRSPAWLADSLSFPFSDLVRALQDELTAWVADILNCNGAASHDDRVRRATSLGGTRRRSSGNRVN